MLAGNGQLGLEKLQSLSLNLALRLFDQSPVANHRSLSYSYLKQSIGSRFAAKFAG